MWKEYLYRLVERWPGHRVVFSCRTLDYSASLSTPELPVPQVQIEPLSDEQVERFLLAYSPEHGAAMWGELAGTRQLEALRTPFFLSLLVEQIETTGDMPEDRAGLFTGYVRQALKREVERDNPLFAPNGLLDERDVRQVVQWRWRTAYQLPELGVLVSKLSTLAYGMQRASSDGGASQVRIDYDVALGLLADERDDDILEAGVALAVLEKDIVAEEVLYRHQLVQEYFAARELAEHPNPELVRAEWRAAEISPSVRELVETLPPAETLPALPQTGWEETTVLAAAMTAEPEAFLRALVATNLALAGRCANVPVVRTRLSEMLLDELRWALVRRSRDPAADLRARIAAGLELGWLGDPRFERRAGPYGEYLMPPLVEIPGGVYPIGEDEPIWDDESDRWDQAHMPRHMVELTPFAIGQFLVTNAEWACFMAAGGYEDEQWWDSEAGRAWRRGEGTAEGAKSAARGTLRLVREKPHVLEQWHDSGQMDDAPCERWHRRLAMEQEEFEAHLAELYPGGRRTEPGNWREETCHNPVQPVVGICWYEARAYCTWLMAQTGLGFRLPTEVECEAAARGVGGRLYANGDEFDPLCGNSLESRLRRPAPVGVFVKGDTPEGLADMTGNVDNWTSSLWGRAKAEPEYGYPYRAVDGREDASAPPEVRRVVRGGSWNLNQDNARTAFRFGDLPVFRYGDLGVRVAVSFPNTQDDKWTPRLR